MHFELTMLCLANGKELFLQYGEAQRAMSLMLVQRFNW